jgi:hypothetical protein
LRPIFHRETVFSHFPCYFSIQLFQTSQTAHYISYTKTVDAQSTFAYSLLQKKQGPFILGNIIGSNLFNTLAVVGIAGIIHPLAVDPEILSRDLPVMTGLTISLFVIGYGFRKRPGRINRLEGLMLIVAYVLYIGWIIGWPAG